MKTVRKTYPGAGPRGTALTLFHSVEDADVWYVVDEIGGFRWGVHRLSRGNWYVTHLDANRRPIPGVPVFFHLTKEKAVLHLSSLLQAITPEAR